MQPSDRRDTKRSSIYCQEDLFCFPNISLFLQRSLYLYFYKGLALLEMETLQIFCFWGCSELITALIKQVERFPSLSSLFSSGGWLHRNTTYSVILKQLSNCQIPTSSSRFSSFKAQLGFLSCSFLWGSQQLSSLRYHLRLEQIKDADREAAGILWCYLLPSKSCTSSRGGRLWNRN